MADERLCRDEALQRVVTEIDDAATLKLRETNMDNWIWGLSLIALTLAIHATGVAFMVSALHRLRLRLARRTLRFPHVFVIVITAITTLGLMLAALHATEAAIWAAAYLWLGAFIAGSGDPLLCRFDGHARRVGGHVATPLADAGRPRGRRWYAAVRDQHGLHLHRDAGPLSGPKLWEIDGHGGRPPSVSLSSGIECRVFHAPNGCICTTQKRPCSAS